MKYTNKRNLPQPVVDATINDAYPKNPDWDISVTQLIDSPQIRRLKKENADRLEVDVSDRLWALWGQAIHAVFERAAGPSSEYQLIEKRMRIEIDGKKISGQLDRAVLETVGRTDKPPTLRIWSLRDWKVTSVWNLIYGSSLDSWTKQLNVLALILFEHGYRTVNLSVDAFLRDWSQGKAKRERDYPDCQLVTVPIERWPHERTLSYVREQLKRHFGGPQECTDEERWRRPDIYAVMKTGRKSAVKLFDASVFPDAFDRANAMAAQNKGFYVQLRKGSCVRCEDYCDVAKFCPQFQKEKQDAEETK